MVELYTLQRFLHPQGLADRGIEHFDAWAATFGEVVETMEISPDGASLRPRSRFARFNNLPELQQMFRSFADVQTAEMLDLPRPRLEGDKPIIVACPPSDEQTDIQLGGTNVQKRLVALHHLDAPWKPAEVEQREGRILRQGNENEEVSIFRYVTEGSFDAFMWQALETKARFISQVMTGDTAVRHAEDIGGQELSYAEVKAIASGNPAVLTLAEADAKLQRLAVLQKNHADEQFLARRKLRELPETIEQLTDRRTNLEIDEETLTTHANAPTSIGDRTHDPDDVPAILEHRLHSLPASVSTVTRFPLGEFRGMSFGITLHPHSKPDAFLKGATTRSTSLSSQHPGPRAVLNALERLSGSYAVQREQAGHDLKMAQEQLSDYQARLGEPFLHKAYLGELRDLRDRLKNALSTNSPAPDEQPQPSISELAERINRLHSTHTSEAAPRSSHEQRVSTAEEPVTTRVRRRLRADVAPPPDVDSAPHSSQSSLAPLGTDMSQAATSIEVAESTVTALAASPRKMDFQEQARRSTRPPERQLSLF